MSFVSSVVAPQARSRFVFFGGKGGVGKTTCAAAWAVGSARRGSRVLIVSTDPAHSLGDVLSTSLSGRVSRIRMSVGHLDAVELDAPKAFARWLRRHRQPLGDILEHGTWLDRSDVDTLLDLALPGIDELMGLHEVLQIAETARLAYDEVVVDTAPTGHTLRLFNAPDTVDAVSSMLDALQQEHRLIREQFARATGPEAADRLIDELANQAARTAALLRDGRATAIKWVMLPERLSSEETADALRDLQALGIGFSELIVNRLTPGGPPCGICDRQRAGQRTVVSAAHQLFQDIPVRLVPETVREPKGRVALTTFSRQLFSRLSAQRTLGGERERPRKPSGYAFSVMTPRHAGGGNARALESLSTLANARLVFVVGKGGVGKTTVAAAAALQLAGANPTRRILVISTDPAHSLGDALNVAVGDSDTIVPGFDNLHARELNANALLERRRASLEEAVAEIATTLGGSTGLSGADGVKELMRLTPPGIDELLGLLSLIEVGRTHEDPSFKRADPRRPDLVIVDTAPTGHALRLLEMPANARQWLDALLRMLLKYKDLVRPGRLAAELVVLSRSVRTLDRMLHDPAKTRFLVVSRASELPRSESERLLKHLQRRRFAVPILVVNAMTLAADACPRCRARAQAERRPYAALRRACRHRARGCAIIQTALAAPPPVGVETLTTWIRTWTSSR